MLDLDKSHNLEKQDCSRYLQLRHYFDKIIKTTEEKGMSLMKIFIDAYKVNTKTKLISRIYFCLQSERGLSTTYIKSKWEKEANIKLTKEDWLKM